jgi:hypothetical protein
MSANNVAFTYIQLSGSRSIPLGAPNGRPFNCPSLAQLVDNNCGYIIQKEHKSCVWRELFPNFGEITTLPHWGVCYTIATDGVHLLAWSGGLQQWIDVSIDNWNGPISLQDDSAAARAALGYVELKQRDEENKKLRKTTQSPEELAKQRLKREAKMIDDLVL